MSFLEVDLKEYLASLTAITSIVLPAQIYPAFISSSAVFPAISITTVGQTKERTLGGNLIASKRVQIDAFAVTFMTCKMLSSHRHGSRWL